MKIIEQATALLRAGELVAIPTETVYGLGADAKNPSAIQKIYTVKGRPSTNPLIIHIADKDALSNWAVDISKEAYMLAEAFWPGPLTLILKRHPSVPKMVTGGQDTIAIRIPNHPLTLELLEHFKGGIAAPSANRYGKISPTTADHVREEFGNQIPLILDGGPCKIGIESTILYCVSDMPFILREGHISASSIARVLQKTESDPLQATLQSQKEAQSQANIQSQKEDLFFPGQSASHYAPNQPLYLVSKMDLLEKAKKYSEENKPFSVLCFFEKPRFLEGSSLVQWIHLPLDPIKTAEQLYYQMRALDKLASNCILVEQPPQHEEWLAIIDRLQRAAFR